MCITEWKKTVWKGYTMCVSNYIAFWRKRNCGDGEKLNGHQGKGGEWWGWRDGAQKIFTQGKYSGWYYNDGYRHYTIIQTYSTYNTKSKPNVNYKLWVLGCVNIGSSVLMNIPLWGVWEYRSWGKEPTHVWGRVSISTPYPQFCYETKMLAPWK